MVTSDEHQAERMNRRKSGIALCESHTRKTKTPLTMTGNHGKRLKSLSRLDESLLQSMVNFMLHTESNDVNGKSCDNTEIASENSVTPSQNCDNRNIEKSTPSVVDIASARKKRSDDRTKPKNTADEYGKTSESPVIYKTAQQILDTDYPPIVWTVEKILPEGLGMLVAKPKVAKTMLATNIAISVSEGSKALGLLEVRKGRVLFLALEDSERRLKERLCKMLPYGRHSALNNIDFTTDFPGIHNKGIEKLTEYVESHKDTRLIVIDTWGRFSISDRNDNVSYNKDVNDLSKLQRFAGDHHISVLLIHHTRKSDATDEFDTISGTTGISGTVDFQMILTRGRGSDIGSLSISGREVKEDKVRMRFSPDTLTWQMLSDDDKNRADKEKHAKILECFTRNPNREYSPSDICALMTEIGVDVDNKYVSNLFIRWWNADKIDRTGRGNYKAKAVSSSKHGESDDEKNGEIINI